MVPDRLFWRLTSWLVNSRHTVSGLTPAAHRFRLASTTLA